MRLALDPGHGGVDPGAVGKDWRLLEKEVNLEVARQLSELLSEAGLEVILTRQDDSYVSLQERAEAINTAGVDVVISLHVNSSGNRDADYLSAHVFSRESRGAELGEILLNYLARATGWPNGGVRVNDFYILRETRPPAVLMEIGFISHAAQEKFLSTAANRAGLARALAEGILAWAGVAGVSFSDIVGHWAERDIVTVAREGLMSGYADGTFHPDAPATRAELAAVTRRLWERIGNSN